MARSSSNKLKQGDSAPDCDLEGTGSERVTLRAQKGKKVVLYFYPKDDTPGCTTEACGFRDTLARVSAKGAVVLGVSPDALDSHDRFRQKYDLPFTLLSDPDHAVAKRYGAYGEKNLYGKKTMGIIRSTFLIGQDGKIEAVWSPVKVEGHVDQVLAALAGAN